MATGIPPDAHEVYRRYVSAVILHGLASAAALDLNATDLYALNVIQLSGAMTSGELAAHTGLTTGATTRLIDRLEQRGHLRRVIDPADRRKIYVEPTGQHLALDKVMTPSRLRIAEILNRCTPDQLAALFTYFADATEAYQAAIAEIRASPQA